MAALIPPRQTPHSTMQPFGGARSAHIAKLAIALLVGTIVKSSYKRMIERIASCRRARCPLSKMPRPARKILVRGCLLEGNSFSY
jgi:hypothetical protein